MWNPPDPDFFNKVWRIVRQIPPGTVSSYGQIASMIPPLDDSEPEQHRRLAPRWVGAALRASPDEPIPWQRVINSQGKISLGGASGETQRQRLESEGVVFDENGRVDLQRYGWRGPAAEWLEEHGFWAPESFGPQQKSLL